MSIGKLNGLFHRSPEPRCPRSCLPRLGHASLHHGDQPLAHRAEDSALSSINGVVPIDLPPPTDREMGQYLETRIAFVRACNLITLIVFIFGAVHLMSFGWPVLFPMIAASATFLSMLTGTYLVFVARPKFDMQHHEHALDRLRRAGAWPTIDVFLPICGEPAEVLLNTWRHVARLDYPGQLQVYVLDDSKTEAMKAHALRHGFNYLRRPNPGEWKKAGNLKAAFDRTCGEFILVLDNTPRTANVTDGRKLGSV